MLVREEREGMSATEERTDFGGRGREERKAVTREEGEEMVAREER